MSLLWVLTFVGGNLSFTIKTQIMRCWFHKTTIIISSIQLKITFCLWIHIILNGFHVFFSILLFLLHLLLPFLPFPLLLLLLLLLLLPLVAMWLENNVLLWFYYEFTMSKQARVARWQAIWSKTCWQSKDSQ